jgi:hypothetical protein
MAHHRQICNENEKTDPDLLAHIAALGLKTTDDYTEWCARHGFSRRLNKHWRQRLKERSFRTEAICLARLSQKKRELRKPDKILEAIWAGDLKAEAVTQPHLKQICLAFDAAKSCDRMRQSLLDLLLHVGSRSKLLLPRFVIPEYGRTPGNTYVGGLLALARFSHEWLRPLNHWKPQTHNVRRQFSSLARHLVAEWPVPIFMDSAWFKGDGADAVGQQKWFLHVGSGKNIRTADLPLVFTKRMAHHFIQAPSDLTVEAALRWGQIHGLGGDARIARAVLPTRIGTVFENDDFWITVLRFFIANPMLDTAHFGPIIDHIHHQRFVSEDVIVSPGVVERRGPPQPNFTMKGRSVELLLAHVSSWHQKLAKTQPQQPDWAPSGIDGFEFMEGSEKKGTLRIWTITEVLTAKVLVAEGRAMKHCVGTYARSCARGTTSIWTLEAETDEGRAKLLTIEVRNAANLICQARGKCNAMPADKHRNILRRWAESAGLTLASYV